MTVLDDIIAGVREDLTTREACVSSSELAKSVETLQPPLDVVSALRAQTNSGTRIIAEVKRKSPSKGELARISDPGLLAHTYEQGGAAAISVLTESRRFNGSLDDLDAVRSAVSIPVLRKEFIISPYQILEARVHGADFILLIVAALDQATLESFIMQTHGLGMEALVEVHNRQEVQQAIDAGARIVGVNARNLKTLEVHPHVVEDLLGDIPADLIRVGESGIHSPRDVTRYLDAGADAVLMGEALVTSGDPLSTIQDMVAAGRKTNA